MDRFRPLIAMVGSLILWGGLLSVQGQTSSTNIEQQLRSQYRVTRVGANGVVVGEAGAILMMQEDGLAAIPASYGAYWYNTFKKGGHIKPNMVQHVGLGIHDAMAARKAFQVGEKLYLTNLEVTQSEIVLYVQSCGKCDSSVDPNDPPYRARLAFQFDKGSLSSADSKQVLETIGLAFRIGTSPPTPEPSGAPPSTPTPASRLKLPSTYVSAKTPTDQLQLNADNSFSLQEGGQSFHGTFVVSGNSLELSINESGIKTTGSLQGNSLTDSSGQTWVLREGPVQSAPSVDILQNKDVIKMAKAGFDDAIIITKIGSSNCQFDMSTDALIQLKQAGVDAAVLKAMLGARK